MGEEESLHRGGVRVSAVHLKLGALTGVVKDALRSSWEMACEGTSMTGARLEIEDVPVVVYCQRCKAERSLASIQWFVCPECKSVVSEVVRGRELQVFALELQE